MHVFLAEGVSTFDFCEFEGITPTSLARGPPFSKRRTKGVSASAH
jgi:hypothetical protein